MAGDGVSCGGTLYDVGFSLLQLVAIPCPLRVGLFFDYAVKMMTTYNVQFHLFH